MRQVKCEQVRPVLGEYLEETLESTARRDVAAHLQTCADCARETRTMAQLLTVLHQLPPREPVLDIWQELEPKIALARAEASLSFPVRVRLQVGRFLSNVSYGAILFTQALAINTTNRLQKYLIPENMTVGGIG